MLEISFCKIKMRNPLVLASGIRGINANLLIRAGKEGAGAATSKSCTLLPREGHPNPTVLCDGNIFINAIGLSNTGVDEEISEIKSAVAGAGIPIFASIAGFSKEEYAKLAEKISQASPSLIEVNISCPNIEGKMFSHSARDAAEVISAVRNATKLPISAKLSPDVPNIGEIAKACIEAGADCITAINCVPGMLIDPYAKMPILSNKFGGVSGPLLKPIAIRCVYAIRKAVGEEIPIIGTGGVWTGKDAIEMLMAGATAVGIGTAAGIRKNAFKQIAAEMQSFMRENGYTNISQLKLEE